MSVLVFMDRGEIVEIAPAAFFAQPRSERARVFWRRILSYRLFPDARAAVQGAPNVRLAAVIAASRSSRNASASASPVRPRSTSGRACTPAAAS